MGGGGTTDQKRRQNVNMPTRDRTYVRFDLDSGETIGKTKKLR